MDASFSQWRFTNRHCIVRKINFFTNLKSMLDVSSNGTSNFKFAPPLLTLDESYHLFKRRIELLFDFYKINNKFKTTLKLDFN